MQGINKIDHNWCIHLETEENIDKIDMGIHNYMEKYHSGHE